VSCIGTNQPAMAPAVLPAPLSLGDQQAMAERRPWQCMAGGLAPDVPAHGRRDGLVKREADGGRAGKHKWRQYFNLLAITCRLCQ
jgi:hypothetical protein